MAASYQPMLPMKPTPKRLILNLLAAAAGEPLSARNAVDACALFGVKENSVRVTLARLSSEGLIEAKGRGLYGLTPHAASLAADINDWRRAEQRLCDWQGGWVAVYCGALGRSDRAVLRQRERALEMNGLRELEKGIYVRPDNLAGGVPALRERLYALGLEPEAMVCRLDELDDGRAQQARQLWPVARLEMQYRAMTERLEQWLARSDDLEPEVAARESFLIGDAAIRQLVFDPLLPEALIDHAARRVFIESLLRFDAAGHRIWAVLYQTTVQVSADAGGTLRH